MMLRFFAISFLTFTALAANSQSWSEDGHFYIRTVTGPSPARIQSMQNCRENINKVICLVEPRARGQNPEDRPCLEGGQAYSHFLEGLYDNYPPAFQKMFCSLRHIFIEKQIAATAYAGLLKDEQGKMIGAEIGIRKSILDENLNLKTWASWKEQLSFGGTLDSYTSRADLPIIETQSNSSVNDFLYFAISHEFGHIFDFANQLNKTKNCTAPTAGHDDEECEMDASGWGGISWVTNKIAKPENEFVNRRALCFYWCEGHPLEPAAVWQVYEGLFQSEFISLYATTQPWDDFADSMAYFAMHENLHTSYVIDTQEGHRYDIMKKLESPLFAKKYQYIKKFLERTDIVYP